MQRSELHASIVLTLGELNEIADYLVSFAEIDEGEYIDTDRLYELAAKLREKATS